MGRSKYGAPFKTLRIQCETDLLAIGLNDGVAILNVRQREMLIYLYAIDELKRYNL